MLNSRITIILGLSILSLIVFDALQQKFYVETFNLATEGVDFLYFIKSHSLRWFIWMIGSIPYLLFAHKLFSKQLKDIPNKNLLHLTGSVILSLIAVLLVISLVSMLLFSDESSISILYEWVIFIFFQKTLSFSLASALLILMVYNSSTKQVISAQWLKINSLKEEAILISNTQENKTISIKIGNRLKVILLSDIYWIESDDYCVKIHTKNKAYSLRKSLKYLEKELVDFDFVRVHRKALLNLTFLDHIDFGFGLVKLSDNTEVPLSKSGAHLLRKVVS